jgi:2-polyprenyl-6-methoxyphenol hydroxylase-like FAD-dependent oxidoreductase
MASAQQAQCCVVGGGPAGMMLGFLLARAGVSVIVIEKHADFLRDFRGDTIHPSTLELMYELGLLEEFLKRPHQELRQLTAVVGGETVTPVDFSHLPTHCKFIALMPQWDFLNFLAEQGRRYPTFHLHMNTEVTGLVEENGRVAGIHAKTPEGATEIRADLVIGADGRHSKVREAAGLTSISLGAPMDVLWMQLKQHPDDPHQALGYFDRGRILVTIDRGDYWQCAFVIPKGTVDQIRQRGLDSFRDDIAQLAPFLRDRLGELSSWDDIKLLTVLVDRLKEWYRPGLLCIGDAAHAMSPIGGVGINVAIQDAVAAANILASPLSNAAVTTGHLREVQRRRTLPVRAMQSIQLLIQNRVIRTVLTSGTRPSPPFAVRLLNRIPYLRRIPARLLGVGIRPEHIHTPDRISGASAG